MKPLHKALVFRASSIGDCLMARYLLENIHAQFPDARCGIAVAGRGNMIRDLLADTPWIEVVEANRRNLKGLWRLWRDWNGSDLVVTQYAGKHGGQFGLAGKLAGRLLARPGGFIGFTDAFRWNSALYSRLLPVRSDAAVAEHEREVLRAAGLGVPVAYPALRARAARDVLQKFNLAAGSYVIVHPFAGNAGRSLHPDKVRELIVELQKAAPYVHCVLSGGEVDRAVALRIAEGLPRATVVAGEATLQEMLGLIAAAAGVVSVDTGVAHLTAHLHRPLVVLRTCLGPNWWFPGQYGPDAPIAQFSREDLCKPHVFKHYPDCINQISMAEVAAACIRKSGLIQ